MKIWFENHWAQFVSTSFWYFYYKNFCKRSSTSVTQSTTKLLKNIFVTKRAQKLNNKMASSYLHRKMKTIYFIHYFNYHLKMFSSSRYYYCLKINVKSVFTLERFVHIFFHPYIQEEEMIIFFDNSILMSITFHNFSLCFHAVMWKSNLLIFFAIWKECEEKRRRRIWLESTMEMKNSQNSPFFFSLELRCLFCLSCFDLLHFLFIVRVGAHVALSLVVFSLSRRVISPFGWHSPQVPLSYRHAIKVMERIGENYYACNKLLGQISYERGNYCALSKAWCHFVIYGNLQSKEPLFANAMCE